jgi:hypothetical protein
MTRILQSNAVIAREAWGDQIPVWVATLARECDRTNQRQVAQRLGKSGGYVSRIINAKYAGDYFEAEQQVQAILNADKVDCPAFGTIPLETCLRSRRRKSPATNAMQRSFDQHCPRCPLNTDRKDDQ